MEVRPSLTYRFLQSDPSEVLPRSVDEIASTIRIVGDDQCGDRIDGQLEFAPGLGQVCLAASQRFCCELEVFDVAMRRNDRVCRDIARQSSADEAPEALARRCR